MNKELKFILLPTNDKPRIGQIVKDKSLNHLFIANRTNIGNNIFDDSDNFDFVNGNYISLELYILSNDEIELDEIYLDINGNTFQYMLAICNNDSLYFANHTFYESEKIHNKIVATTDFELNLPIISESDLNTFILKFNAGAIVDKVIVDCDSNKEYLEECFENIEQICYEDHENVEDSPYYDIYCLALRELDNVKETLIINPDNTINIKFN